MGCIPSELADFCVEFWAEKRVTIASILVLEPELLILDEPTAGQDFKHYTEMMTFLEELNRLGVTILMITHDMHLMLEYTTRALVVCDGRLLADATPVAVLTDEKLIQAASLKETSLFTFAKALGLENPCYLRKNLLLTIVRCVLDE